MLAGLAIAFIGTVLLLALIAQFTLVWHCWRDVKDAERALERARARIVDEHHERLCDLSEASIG